MSVCPWMVLSPAQTLDRRQDGEDWVRAVSDYTIGDLTVMTRATTKSSHGTRPWVPLFLAAPRMTSPSSIGEPTGQPALPGYQQSSFRTVCLRMCPVRVCTLS